MERGVVRYKSYGAAFQDKAIPRTPQKRCACGEPISSRKSMCWDCESTKIEERKTAQRREKRARLREGQET
jgi:hypothetical protein